MHFSSRKFVRAILLIPLVASQSAIFYAASRRANEQLAIIRQWLPQHHEHLQLIFEYDSENRNQTARSMHKVIDRAGPTVTLIEAKIPYHDQVRTIGGYNPYKWKSWNGRYKENAGRFIFDLDKETKWDRQTSSTASFKPKPDDYGLSFGNGDLKIHPDLKYGSARNTSFAPASDNLSILLGQAGEFEIQSIRIYKVSRFIEGRPTAISLRQAFIDNESSQRHPVPDNTNPLLLLAGTLTSLALVKAAISGRPNNGTRPNVGCGWPKQKSDPDTGTA